MNIVPNSVQVVVRLSPFDEGATASVPAGQSIAEILGDSARCDEIVVYHEGSTIPRAYWRHVRPYAGTILEVVIPPKAEVVIALAAAFAGAAVETYLLTTAFGAAIAFGSVTVAAVIGAAAGAVVSLGLSMLITPQAPSIGGGPGQARNYYDLIGQANASLRYGVLPKLYGEYQYFPPHAANPYTEVVNGDTVFLHLLYCLNIGPVKIGAYNCGPNYGKIIGYASVLDAIEIDGTPLSEFSDVDVEIGTIDQITVYTNDIVEDRVGAELPFPDNQTADSGFVTQNLSVVRRTALAIDRVSVDIHFPGGLWTMGKDGKLNKGDYIDWKIEYSVAGADSYTELETFRLKTRRDPFTTTKAYNFENGQYDIKVTRISTYWQDKENQFLDATWSALRSIKFTRPWTNSDSTMLALRIKGTDQLSGNIDRVSVKAKSILDVWTGSEWLPAATDNPAWAYADILRGAQLAEPVADSRIDGDTLKDWANWCQTESVGYNAVHVTSETMLDRLRQVASTGRAAWALRDGKFTVVRDSGSAPTVQVISPRNSWGFSSSKIFMNLPHAFRVRYIDPNTWEQAEAIVYDDGYDSSNATRFEVLDTRGVTNYQQAWREGRFHLAQARLRPEVYTVTMDFEHLRAERGDRVRLAHDAMLVGLAWGRVKSVSGTAVTLDEAVPMEIGKSYALRARLQDGSVVLRGVVTDPGFAYDLTLGSAISGLAAGDLCLFGESGLDSIDALITRIEPHPDLSATVTLVDYAPEVQNADVEIPEYDPNITIYPDVRLLPPEAAYIISAVSSSATLVADPSGTFLPGIKVSWGLPPGRIPVAAVEIAYSMESGVWQYVVFSSTQNSATITNIIPDTRYSIKIRSQSALSSKWSKFSGIAYVDTVGPSAVPQDVENFSIAVVGDQAVLRWDAAIDVDVLLGGHVRISYTADATATSLGDAQVMAYLPGTATTATIPARDGAYFAEFEDAGGRRSATPAVVVTSIPGLVAYNVVSTLSEPTWAGSVSGGAVISGSVVKLGSDAEIDDVADWDDIVLVDSLDGLSNTGTYTSGTIDLGGKYPVRIYGGLEASTYYVTDLVDSRNEVDGWLDVDGEVYGPTAVLRYQVSDNGSTWADAKNLSVDTAAGRYFRAVIALETDNAQVNVSVTAMTLTLDVPDRVASGVSASVPASGLVVTYSPPFAATPAVACTIHAATAGYYYDITSSARTGFTVYIRDNVGTAVSGTIDWLAKGYGSEIT